MSKRKERNMNKQETKNKTLCHPELVSGSRSGFTLAETLIALTVLGIVAAITVPQLVRKQAETANRTKLKKAMTK